MRPCSLHLVLGTQTQKTLRTELSRDLDYITQGYVLDIFLLNKVVCIGYFRERPYLELSNLYLYEKRPCKLSQILFIHIQV
jgi:hypothetical protein